LQNDHYEGDEFFCWPINGSESVLGIRCIPSDRAGELSDHQKKLFHSMIESSAMAMDRLRVMKEKIRSGEEAARERYRGNLLRAISHDLRTPLAEIMGTGEMIMDMTDKSDPRYALADGIYKDADRLNALVENILSLKRLQDVRLMLRKEPEPVEEVIGVAVAAMEKRVPGREIVVNIPGDIFV
jgi:two-component system sensor histidine kinase KdpD